MATCATANDPVWGKPTASSAPFLYPTTKRNWEQMWENVKTETSRCGTTVFRFMSDRPLKMTLPLSGVDMPYLTPQETADLFELPVRLPWLCFLRVPQHLIYFAHCTNWKRIQQWFLSQGRLPSLSVHYSCTLLQRSIQLTSALRFLQFICASHKKAIGLVEVLDSKSQSSQNVFEYQRRWEHRENF